MRLTGLELERYRCFESVDLDLEAGVTVIHGANGAGKTTLLESILFGLYGSNALADATLSDIVTRGEEECLVTLDFVHQGGDYHLEREVAIQGERATTRSCVLEEPGGERYEGASDVRARITELLRMDAEAFVNSAYVKQGEINKLLHATPAERQSMIDELLQLGRLEAYRDRADEARLAARALARERGERVDELESQRERLLDPDPYERLNDLESELEQVSTEVEETQNRLDELRERKQDLEQRRDELAEQREELEELRSRREELVESLEDLEERRNDIRSTMADHRSQRRETSETLENRLEAVDIDDVEAVEDSIEAVDREIESVESEIETHRDDIEAARERAAEARERKSAITDRLSEHRDTLESVTEQLADDREVLEERQADREETKTALEQACSDLEVDEIERAALEARERATDEQLEQLQERRRALRDSKAAITEHIEQAESLADEDKCPTCGQPVDESPHIESLEDDRATLEEIETEIESVSDELKDLEGRQEAIEAGLELCDRLERIDELVEERADVVEERESRREELQETIEHAKEALEQATATVESAESDVTAKQEAIAETNEQIQELREHRSDLVDIKELAGEVTDHEDEIDRLEERLEHLDELEHDRRDQLDDIDERISTLTETLESGSRDDLEEELTEVEEHLETASETLDAATGRRDELTEAIGSVRSDIERLESVNERLESASSIETALDGLREEATELGQLYESVRAELRERNVATLERLLNETFELLYRNDAYERIDLDQDYELSVHSKDGTELDPAQLSGGERAIFNLSLRCAIYRLLAEGVEGAAPMPPLMLDEPTVFLDQGHVGRLLRLLETMRDIGVEQTLVVSHHEALLDAAEHRIAVEKDPTTNRSTVAELAAARPP